MPDILTATVATAVEGGATNPESTQTPATPAPEVAAEPSRGDRIQKMVREMVAKSAPPSPAPEPSKDSPAAPAEGTPVLSETPPAAAEAATEAPAETPPADAAAEAPPEDIRKAIARIRQLKDQRKALKATLSDKDAAVAALTAQVEALQAQVDRSQAKPTTPSFESVEDPQAIEAEVKQATAVADWAQDTLDQFTGEDDVESVGTVLEGQGLKAPADGWTAKAIKQTLVAIRNNAKATRKAGQDRHDWLRIEGQALEYVAKTAPKVVSDPAVEAEVTALLEARPSLKAMPEWPVAALALVLGMRQLKGVGTPTPAAAAKPPPPTPPRPPAVPGAPRAAAPAPEAEAEVRKRALAPGASREDRQAYFKALLLKQR